MTAWVAFVAWEDCCCLGWLSVAWLFQLRGVGAAGHASTRPPCLSELPQWLPVWSWHHKLAYFYRLFITASKYGFFKKKPISFILNQLFLHMKLKNRYVLEENDENLGDKNKPTCENFGCLKSLIDSLNWACSSTVRWSNIFLFSSSFIRKACISMWNYTIITWFG